MEISEFGKFIRTKRLLLEMTLGEMADALDVSSSYLSSVEVGRKPVPKEWAEKITKILQLNKSETEKLKILIDGEIGTKKVRAESREAAVFLAAFNRNGHRIDGKTLSLWTKKITDA